jgi:hypothetical protein
MPKREKDYLGNWQILFIKKIMSRFDLFCILVNIHNSYTHSKEKVSQQKKKTFLYTLYLDMYECIANVGNNYNSIDSV